MRTHKEAKYARIKGDKRRPVVAQRPTLKVIGARLRRLKRQIKIAVGTMKQGDPAPDYVVNLYKARLQTWGYLASIGHTPTK